MTGVLLVLLLQRILAPAAVVLLLLRLDAVQALVAPGGHRVASSLLASSPIARLRSAQTSFRGGVVVVEGWNRPSSSFCLWAQHRRRDDAAFQMDPSAPLEQPGEPDYSSRKMVGDDGNNNWIERSFPLAYSKAGGGVENADENIIDYDLGLDGTSWGTGALSKRMYEAMLQKTVFDASSRDIQRAFKLCAMDFTAKEAVRAALQQNGLELILNENEQDQGMWGSVDSIRLLEDDENNKDGTVVMYDDWEDCVDRWSPGQDFSFVARQVPAKIAPLTLDQLLEALDPDGSLQKQAQEAGLDMPVMDDIHSLAQLVQENRRRVHDDAPQGVTPSNADIFDGTDAAGYRVLSASDLLQHEQEERVVMHVMDAMVSHGCLIVDLGDDAAGILARVWTTAEDFFERVSNDSTSEATTTIPPLQTASATGSSHAKVGYANYADMEFLETRRRLHDGTLLPVNVVSDETALCQAMDVVANVVQAVTRVAVAAASQEVGIPTATAVEGARKLAEELLDNGRRLLATNHNAKDDDDDAVDVSMSPHRLCRYSATNTNTNSSTTTTSNPPTAREIFGAHTDSTFVTAVPVAAVAGLEVYDEAAEQWYRPELMARRHWRARTLSLGNDPDGLTENMPRRVDDGDDNSNNLDTTNHVTVPWHARYVVLMPGELMQLATRNEIMAAVHRVVVATDRPRLSVPLLFRGRPQQIYNCQRYLGGTMDSALQQECDGLSLREIHDALQQQPTKKPKVAILSEDE